MEMREQRLRKVRDVEILIFFFYLCGEVVEWVQLTWWCIKRDDAWGRVGGGQGQGEGGGRGSHGEIMETLPNTEREAEKCVAVASLEIGSWSWRGRSCGGGGGGAMDMGRGPGRNAMLT
jgi:hypothetical protein